MTMQDMPNKRHAPKMVRIGLLFLCLAYAHTAVAAVAHQRHSSPSKKTTIILRPMRDSCPVQTTSPMNTRAAAASQRRWPDAST
jgi:hypothetical protein